MKNILDFQTKTITSSALVLAVAFFASAVLGFFRDRLLAGRFGAGDELDIYYAAFRIPDFICAVFIMGAISAAIIPVFSQHLLSSRKEAQDYLGNLLNFFSIGLILISFVLIIFTPKLIGLIAPGFSESKCELTILLTRIMFLSPIFLGIGHIISAALKVLQRFLVVSLAPIMYNLGIIFGILFFVPRIGISGLAWGVALGGLLYLLIELPIFFKLGFRLKAGLNLFHPGLKETIMLTLPRSLGVAVTEFNFIVIVAIASTLVSGSIAVLNLSHNFSHFLIRLVAIPLSVAAFPVLALAFSEGNREKFIQKLSFAFRQILYLLIPISCLAFLLRAQIIRVILGTGRFDWVDTQLTAACLGIFCFGIFAYGLSNLLAKTFYAVHNTKTPAVISSICVVFNIILCFLLVGFLASENAFRNFMIRFLDLQGIENIAVIALPLALAISNIFQFSLLLIFLKKRIKELRLKVIWRSLEKIILATVLSGIFTYLTLSCLAPLVNMQTFFGVLIQGFLAGMVGILIYLLATLLLKSPELKTMKSVVLRRFISSK